MGGDSGSVVTGAGSRLPASPLDSLRSSHPLADFPLAPLARGTPDESTSLRLVGAQAQGRASGGWRAVVMESVAAFFESSLTLGRVETPNTGPVISPILARLSRLVCVLAKGVGEGSRMDQLLNPVPAYAGTNCTSLPNEC
jgi:hypothetical protein